MLSVPAGVDLGYLFAYHYDKHQEIAQIKTSRQISFGFWSNNYAGFKDKPSSQKTLPMLYVVVLIIKTLLIQSSK